MKNSLKLKEQRAALVEELQGLVDLATSEERDFTEQEEARQGDIHNEVNSLDAKIEAAEKTEKVLLRSANEAKATAVDMGVSSSDKREQNNIAKRFSLTEGIRSLAQGRPLEGVLREMDQEARKEANESGISLRGEFNIPAFLSYGEKRTAYGVDSGATNVHASGNNIVQVSQAPVALSLQSNSVLQAAGATQLSGFSGDVQLPVMPGNAASVMGGSGDDNTEADGVSVGTTAFTSSVLKPTRFAGAVDVSKHLMYSMNGQLDDLFGRDLSNAIAAKFDAHVLNKIVDKLETGNRISAGRVSEATNPGKSLATNFRDLGELIGKYLAGNPDDINRAFFLTPEMYGHLLGQTADAGGMIQAANFQEQLMGRPAYITSQIADETILASVMGETDADDTIAVSPIICADVSDIFVCSWAGLSINVDVHTQALKGVVRVVADGFMDGDLRRNGSAAFAPGLLVDTPHTGVA